MYRVLKGQQPTDNIRLPRKLRLALVNKFKTFTEYSLAKYNNTKRKKKEGDLTPTIKTMVCPQLIHARQINTFLFT